MTNTSLKQFVDTVCTESHLRVETNFGDGFVRLRSDEAQRRQAAHDIRTCEDALIELLRNARDANAHTIFIATTKSNNTRTLVVIDDGVGIPSHMHDLIFQPRVTNKLDTMHFDQWGVHGRGMALYAIKENALSCGVLESYPNQGTAIYASFDTTHTQEKTDQSSFPQFTLKDNSNVSVRGPKNLIRTSCEFALNVDNSVHVYFGSPTEIAATMYFYGTHTTNLLDRTFADDQQSVQLVKKLARAADAQSFCDIAKSLGLELSERSALRIYNNKIPVLEPLHLHIKQALAQHKQAHTTKHSQTSTHNKHVHQCHIAFSKNDKDELSRLIRKDFQELAQRYYLSDNVSVSLSVTNNELVVKIPLIPDESSY